MHLLACEYIAGVGSGAALVMDCCFISKRRSGRTPHLPFPWWFWFPGLLPYGGCVCVVNVAEIPTGCCVVMLISPDWVSPTRPAAWEPVPRLLGSFFDRTRRTRLRGRARVPGCLTTPSAGPFLRRNFISRGIGRDQNKPWLPNPDPTPTPAWLGGWMRRGA